jgi:KipI family sensor histidine kinase inhibitor
MTEADGWPKMQAFGEGAVLFSLDGQLDPESNCRVHLFDWWLGQNPLPGVIERVPAYASLLVLFDPLQLTLGRLGDWLFRCWEGCPEEALTAPRTIEVSVRYGGPEGPDLDFVAQAGGLSPREVIRRHTAPTYRVGMMGFTPGFAYLLGLDSSLAAPRLKTPRTRVPAGSVGIAGQQTGIYPLESPGGWQLIGRTDCRLYDPQKDSPFLLAPGDLVRFIDLEAGE